MDPVIIYGRRLQAGEVPPATLPGNTSPLYVDANGKLLVSVESVEISLPGGGVNILDPIGIGGGILVESKPGQPLEIVYATPQSVNIAGSIVGPGGGVKIEPASAAPFPVEFAAPQEVTFPSAQPVAFDAPQEVVFPSPQQVQFPAAQEVNIASPIGAGNGVRVENNPGSPLLVSYGANIPEVTLAPGLTDPFSRLRISEALTLFDSKFYGDKRPELWDERLVGAGTSAFIANSAEVRLTVGTASGDRVIRQSYQYVPYQPGKGRLAFMTGVISNEPKLGVTSRIGLFDDARDKTAGNDFGGDGTFFEMKDTTMFCVVRSFVGGVATEERAAQSTWNIDKMDGTGPSGITLDWTKSQIFVIDLEWLGVGTVTFAVAYNRKLFIVHQFHHANLIAGVYMRKADLPVRYCIENTAATAGSTYMRQICCTVISEGGYQPAGELHSFNFGTVVKTIGTTEAPLIAIRLRPFINRSAVRLADVQIEMTSSDVVCLNVYTGLITLTGAVWVPADAVNSVVEADRSATAFGGTPIRRYSGYVSPNTRRFTIPPNSIPVSAITDMAGNVYPILITAQNQSATADLLACVTWTEA